MKKADPILVMVWLFLVGVAALEGVSFYVLLTRG